MIERAVVRTVFRTEFDDLLPHGARLIAMPGGCDIGGGDSAGWGKGLTSPIWLENEGGVMFSDIGHHRRLLWVPGKEPVIAAIGGGAIGGTALDSQGRVLGCDWEGRRVIAQDARGEVVVLAEEFEGKKFGRPSAICLGRNGDIMFLDKNETFPPFAPGASGQGRSGVFRIDAAGTVENTGIALSAPGGIFFDAPRSRLLVSETSAKEVWSFNVADEGRIDVAGALRLAQLEGEWKGAPHGLVADERGHIYVGGPGGVWVLAPGGQPLGILHLTASRVNDLCIGGGRLWMTTPVGIACVGCNSAAQTNRVEAPTVLRQPLGLRQAVERHAPELDRIIAREATITNYAWGEFFDDLGGGEDYLASCSLEGLIWDSRHNALLFSDIGNSRRMRLTPETGEFIQVNAPTGNTNGATFDHDGNILSCEQGARRVTRTLPNGERVVVVDRTNDGRRLNCPNDITVRHDGHIYFTDPFWNFGDGRTTDIGHAATWHLAPDGALTEFSGNWIVCNGLALSPDERTLFVNDSYNYHIRAFDLRDDGSVDAASERVHCELKGPGEGKPDGMKLDLAGNIYCGGPGGLWVIDPDGKHLGTIAHGATQTNNLIFGGQDLKDLFFCSWLSMHSIRTLIPGIPTVDAR